MPAPRASEVDDAFLYLTEAEKFVIRYAYDMYDPTHKGYITPQDLNRVMILMKKDTTEADIYAMITAGDFKRNNIVDFQEFTVIATPKISGLTDQEQALEEAYNIFDLRGTGYISLNEVSYIMKQFDEELSFNDILDIQREVRVNSNGEVNIQELLHAMVLSDKK